MTDRRQQIAETYAAGMEIRDIVKRFGCGHATVWRACERYGIPKRRPQAVGRWTPEQKEFVRQKWVDEGLTADAIGELMNVSGRSVIGIIHRCKFTRAEEVNVANRTRGSRKGMETVNGRKAPTKAKSDAPKPASAHQPRLGKMAARMQPAPFLLCEQKRSEPQEEATPKLPKYTGATPHSNPKPWMERLSGECTWPVSGEGMSTFSCCAPVSPGTCWCDDHNRAGRQNWSGKGYHSKPDRFVEETVRRCA